MCMYQGAQLAVWNIDCISYSCRGAEDRILQVSAPDLDVIFDYAARAAVFTE